MVTVNAQTCVLLITLVPLLIVLSCFSVCLRLLARLLKGTPLKFNDWLLVVALLFHVCQSAVELLNAVFGDSTISPSAATSNQIIDARLLGFIGAMLWNVPILCIKLSVLHFYYVLLPNRKFRITCVWMMAIVSVLYFMGCVLAIALACIPFFKGIDVACGDNRELLVATAALDLSIDGTLVLLPTPVVWHVQTSKWKRFRISLVLGAGGLFCLIPALRTSYALYFDDSSMQKYFLATILEPYVGIIVACIPLLWDLKRYRWTRTRPALSPIATGRYSQISNTSLINGTPRRSTANEISTQQIECVSPRDKERSPKNNGHIKDLNKLQTIREDGEEDRATPDSDITRCDTPHNYSNLSEATSPPTPTPDDPFLDQSKCFSDEECKTSSPPRVRLKQRLSDPLRAFRYDLENFSALSDEGCRESRQSSVSKSTTRNEIDDKSNGKST